MYSGLVLALISTCQLSLSYAIDFCDNRTKDNLIDSLFDFDGTIYALRNRYVYILGRDMNGNWTQLTNAIYLKNMFKGYPRNSFNSGFSVTNFSRCDISQEPDCRNENPDFDPTNVTFLFFEKKFYIFRRTELTLFETISTDQEITTIPWQANKIDSGSINDIFDSGNNRLLQIDGAIYRFNNSKQTPTVVIVNDKNAFEFYVTDNKDIERLPDRYMINAIFNSSHSNGAFIVERDRYPFEAGDYAFVYNNKVFRYLEDEYKSFVIQDMGTTSWDFFNCDTMGFGTEQTDLPIIETDTQSEDRSPNQTEPIEQTDVSTESRASTRPSTDSSIGISKMPTKLTSLASIRPPEQMPIDQNTGPKAQEYFDRLKYSLNLTFVGLIFTMICVTILSFISFNILS